MLIVSGTISFDPANAARFHELAAPLTEATLAEPGNLTYGFWADANDPGRVRAYEEWASPEAIAEHFATPHMAAFMEGMGEVGVTAIELHQHTVSETSKLM
jgi:quinol monooxygenase YgiN